MAVSIILIVDKTIISAETQSNAGAIS